MTDPAMAPNIKERESADEDLEGQIQELWNGKEGVIQELNWLQDTVNGPSSAAKKDENGKEKDTDKDRNSKDRIKADMSIKDVLGLLGNKPKDAQHEEQLAVHGRLRNTVTKILKCIETLGGMVAGAASTVFAPAPACFNALSFVIQFWVKHEEMFEKLDELYERCSAFLGRLHTYQNSMTLRLQLVACKALHHVVKIFRHSVEILQSKRKRMKELLKDGFLGESDIKDLLEKLEQLVRDEQGLLMAESFTELKEIAKTITADDAQRRVVADGKLWKSSISASLGLGEEGNELQPESKVALRNIEKSLVQGTGKWFLNDPRYKAWTSADDNPLQQPNHPSVLALHGEGNTGKSFLAANIIKELEARNPRPVVGYYFYQRDPKQPLSDKKLRSNISRSLLWQFATSRNAPTQSMAQASAKMGYNPDDIDIWRQLFLGIDPLKRRGKDPAKKYYIIIDGLEDRDIGSVVPLLYEVARPGEVRVLLTSKDDVVRHFAGEHELHCMSVELDTTPRRNLADIDIFIVDRLDSMDALKAKESPVVNNYREKIRKEVQEKTRGDFIWISTVLNSLARADRASEIDNVLTQIKKTGANQIADEILRLNNSLPDASIDDLNAIILWVVAAQELPTVAEMDAVLFLNFGSLSFIPLHQRLAPFLELNNTGRINFKSPEIKEILSAQKSETTGPVRGAIPENTDTVQRFLEHVCPQKKYDMAELEKFLWGGRQRHEDSGIHYDDANSHVRIAITCLKCLTSTYSNVPEQLRTYAGNHLLFHLEHTRLPEEAQQDKKDTSHVDYQLVEEASLLLLRLFTGDEGIDSLFWTRAEHMSQHAWLASEGKWLKGNRERWLYRSEGVKELARWFTNPFVANIVATSLHANLVHDFVSSEDDGQVILLRFAAKRLAHHLLLEDVFTSREECTAIYFLHGYVSRIQLEGDQERSEICCEDRTELRLDEMLRIETWASSEAIFGKDAKESALWQIQMAVAIGGMCESDNKDRVHGEETNRIERARNLDKHNLVACLVAARQLSDSIDTESSHPQPTTTVRTEALEILENATRDIKRLVEREPNWAKSMSRSLLAAEIYLEIADLYWGNGNMSDAAVSYKKSLSYSSTRYSDYLGMLKRYQEKKRWSDIIDFISALHARFDTSYHARYLDRFIHEFLDNSVFQHAVSEAAEETKSWPEAKKPFFFAFELAQKSPVELFHAHKAYLCILKRGSNKTAIVDDIIKHSKLALACGVPQAENGIGVLYRDIFAVADPLALIYLNKAMALLHKMDMHAVSSRTTSTDDWGFSGWGASKTKSRKVPDKPLPELKRLLDEAGKYGQEIAALVQDTDVWANTSINCCLAWYHVKMDDMTAAKKTLAPMMAAAIALLSDNDTSNDWFAVLYLGRALTTLRDWENAHTAWSILKDLLPDDSDDPLLTCRVCNSGVKFHPGDCNTCYGPVFWHEECFGILPCSGISGCTQNHGDDPGALAFGTAGGQLGPEAVHNWKGQLKDSYVLGGVRVEGKDLSPVVKKTAEPVKDDVDEWANSTSVKVKKKKKQKEEDSIPVEDDADEWATLTSVKVKKKKKQKEDSSPVKDDADDCATLTQWLR